MLGTALHNSGSQFYVDHCTRCTCTNSTVSCIKETCPVLECSSEQQIMAPGRCCPQCPLIEESRASCSYSGITYEASIPIFIRHSCMFLFLNILFCPRQDGETWKLDSCKACACMLGNVRCAMPRCAPLNLPCPPNSKLEHQENQCCPQCVESECILFIVQYHVHTYIISFVGEYRSINY